MKCDELKRKYSDITGPYYGYNEVNEAIAELQAENAQLKAEKERLKKKMDDYHLMSDIRRSKIKELKRTLWLARADRAMAESYSVLNDVLTSNRWVKALGKLKTKAEEYK
ncbi:hypothetical protein [uncultured Fibrobacter sp.]|uniref:hypothetical protein n=1 Tax=uncultured Fibrobacter sp. TaxID=261512 RepID=UPI0025FEC777|nr:hypothetical protein [uncultured Fibrobacter sp.]